MKSNDRSRLRMAAVVLALGVGTSGCGRSDAPPRVAVHEVTGRLLLADGKPMAGGRVYFVPTDGAMTSEGAIQPDGRFALVTADSGAGAPAGEYRLRVEPADPALIPNAKRPRRDAKRLPFPPKYLDEDSSGLRVTVKAGPNTLEPIRLK